MFFVFCSFVLVYLFSGILLFKNSVWSNKKIDLIVFNKNRNIKKWLDFLFIIFVLCTIRVLLTAFLDLFYVGINFGQNTMWITCCFIVMLLIKIWTSPNILYGYNALYEKVKYEKFSKLSLNEIWILTPICNIKNIQDKALKENVYINLKKQINRIEKIAMKDKWFRNNKFSKSELAEKLNIPKSHINFIFKYHSKLSYTEFVNKARTFDAIELIESGYLSTHKMDSLALKVGYMSYNPFFLTFKDITGVSPMEYNKLKNNLK
jgi:AraC-like DNA-binding protein